MERREVLENILVLSLAPVAVYLVWGGRPWLWGGLSIGLLGLLWPAAGALLAKAWQQLAHLLGRVNGSLLLGLVFFLVLWPTALLARLFRREDRLQLRRKTGSYFQVREHTFTAEDLQDPW